MTSRGSTTLRYIAVILTCLGVSGCSVFFDTGAPILPDISPTQAARNHAANAEVQIIASITELRKNGKISEIPPNLISEISHRAEERLTALGGEWKPWGDSDSPNLPTPKELPVLTTPTDLVKGLAISMSQAKIDAQAITDESLTKLLTSISLSRLVDANNLAATLKIDIPQVTVTVTPATSTEELYGEYNPVTSPPKVPRPESGPYRENLRNPASKIVQSLDYARYALTMDAAATTGSDREIAENFAFRLERQINSLISFGAADTRDVAYDYAMKPGNETEVRTRIVSTLTSVLDTQMSLIGSNLDRPELNSMELSEACITLISKLGGDLPTLPGITVKKPT